MEEAAAAPEAAASAAEAAVADDVKADAPSSDDAPASALESTPPPATPISPHGRSERQRTSNPAELVIRSFVEALARLARSHRDAVREAGGIAPLVTLLKSGTAEVQALTAAVLRDLATDNPANREAILKAGGLNELVSMVSLDASKLSAGEAAGALRALSSGFPLGCRAICDAGGVDALISMVAKVRDGSHASIHATGVLANLASQSEANCESILRSGGVGQLVALLSKSHASTDGGRRRVPPEMKLWLERASEEAAHALWQLAANAPSCTRAIREANAIAPLVETLLRSGLSSTTAGFAAKALVELVQADDVSKMTALDAIAFAAKDDKFDGHGWSLAYPSLRQLLQDEAESLLRKAEDETSASSIAYAIDICRALEFPADRLDAARNAFDESMAKQKRDKLAAAGELRRKQKEEEMLARVAAREAVEKRRQEEEAAAELEANSGSKRGGKKAKDEKAVDVAAAPSADTSRRAARAKKGDGADGEGSTAPGGPAAAADGARESRATRKESGASSGRAARKSALDTGLSPLTSRSPRGTPSPARRGGGTSTARGVSGEGGLTPGSGGSASGRGAMRRSSPSARGKKAYPSVEAPRPQVPLHFIPRAQLLEKIQIMASMNKAEPLPQGLVSSDATEKWHHRWDAKYDGFENASNYGREAAFAEPSRPAALPRHSQQPLSSAGHMTPAPAAELGLSGLTNSGDSLFTRE